MNERIFELIQEQDGFSGLVWSEQDKKEFAELIVRECTNMLPNDSIRNEEGVHMFYVIRDHFGVPVIGR